MSPVARVLSPVLSPRERRALRRAVGLLNVDSSRFVLAVLAGTAGMASAVALSGVAAWLIARASQMPDVVALGVAPVAVRLFGVSRSVLRYCERLVSHDTALRGMGALRTRLYEALAAARTDTVAGLRRGDVLARVGSDIDAVGDLVVRAYLPATVAAVLGAVTSVGVGLVYWPAGLILATCLLLSGLGAPLATIRSARMAEQARQRQATELSAEVLAVLEGAPELMVCGRLADSMHQVASREENLVHLRDRAAVPAAIAAALDVAAMGMAVVGNLVIGVGAVAAGRLAPVWLAVIVLVPLAAFEATSALGPASVQLVRSAGAACRIVELIETAETSASAGAAVCPDARKLPTPSAHGPRLRARNLSVGWPGGPVVAEGIDLDLRVGSRVAIVGPSGIGKSTLLATLAGLLEPRGGTLTLDGVPPWQVARSQAAARVCLTAEDAHVFHTNVLENLRVARGDVTPAEARQLLDQAGLGDWLEALPDGVETVVGTDAATLSGGERRRLLLARALAAPAPLMLLDEPGEHLDATTADRLVADLLTVGTRQGRGTLLVTHRLSSLAHADEVLVMGRPPQTNAEQAPATILHRGSHRDLQDVSEAYRWSLSQEDQDRQHASRTS
ncbi:thiol reductant ABC exporter subunit CydC [Actinomyces johnsonii]|uniref:Thiol reductant ABC exporter subunit CydC n=2 Tax=Actinomyces johnsonii TaxID=544581 RepID=A0A508A0X1_9ACTO|nr:thiol reductant ABC exporter subunit CydC [Actinomyces johnsonii]KAA8744266.1 thiol reductant ABC exporter subunit CydC [Actinomyces johnsonii]TQD43690.1 thiol reductant ABC exporter subunit CydC [Actinomyces johnsonii]